jgi:hypothetical protein
VRRDGTRLEEWVGMSRDETFLTSLARPLALASFVGLAVLAACGGKVEGGGPGPDGGNDGGVITEPDGAVCVDIVLSSYDQSCTTSSDCIGIVSGVLCSTSCLCGGSTVNKSGQARYDAALSELSRIGPECNCPAQPAPECVHGTCTLCDSFEGRNPACSDGGTVTSDGSTGDETVTVDAKSTCVEIDLASYDQSCNTASDCTLIETGLVCSGSCNCGGSPINVSGEAQYEKATSGITFEECPCAEEGPLQCVGGTCTLCSGSPPPPGCPDGG